MTDWGSLILVGAGSLAASLLASALALRWLNARQILDKPNDRSSHRRPVPRGGGIGFMIVIVLGFAVAAITSGQFLWTVLLGTLLVGAISFLDDLRPVSFRARLAVQAVAIGIVIATMPGDAAILTDALPIWLDRILVAFAWLWFVNLFNFMDGIDGIAGGEAATVAAGVVVLTMAYALPGDLAVPATIVAAAAAGFLAFNWPPARLFMGDVGSAGLGFVLGWLLIELAARGYLAAALLLPLYFVADASTTLVMRGVRRRPLATAHRDHAYQAAVDRGASHALVSSGTIVFGIILISLAYWSPNAPFVAFALGLVLSLAFIALLRWGPIVPRSHDRSRA